MTEHAVVMADAHRLLKPDGLLITGHPTASCFRLAANVLRLGNKKKPLPDLGAAFAAPWHVALLSIKGTEQLVSREGFRLIEIRRCPQGRFGGTRQVVQTVLDYTNKAGWGLFGTSWPLDPTHIFIFQKTSDRATSATQ